MEAVSSLMVAAAKLLVFNPGEFELWKIRIEQYFLMTDYALWEVIINGDSPPPKRTVDGVEQTYPSTAAEIVILKERVKKLEKKRRSRTYKSRRLYKTQGRNDEDLMFDIGVPNGDEVFEEPMVIVAITTSSIPVSADDPVTTAGEVATTASVDVTTASATTTTVDEPKARGVVVQEPSEFTTTTSPSQASQLPQAKDKGKTKMVKLEKPLKKKDQLHLMKKLLEILKLNYKLNWKKKRGLQDKRKKKPT
ncbi:hypothetical protein Tco_1560829 [Tanacetum coccineum]